MNHIIFTLTFATLLAAATLIVFALVRRKQREEHFREIDQLRCLSSPIISSLAAGILDYQQGLRALNEIFALSPDQARVIERVLFGRRNQAMIPIPALQLLAVDLGLVDLWQRQLLGRFDRVTLRQAVSRPESALERIGPLSFLVRARSAQSLGLIRHRPSWRVLVRALDDPHPDVRSAVVRALGAIAEPQSFGALLERLQAEVLAPSGRLSVADIKAALVRFPLQEAGELAALLNHTHPRIRLLAADVVRGIIERGAGSEEELPLRPDDLASELIELFLTRLAFDKNPDVRARAAAVIARLDDPRAASRLVMLLDDAQWFVRLHAVRALAQRRFITFAEHVTQRLTDPNWRVREAAVRTLLVFGPVGAERLRKHFLTTGDRYSLEQILEELQRSGLLPLLLGDSGHNGTSRESNVVERLARMGKNHCLVTLLKSEANHHPCEPVPEQFAPQDEQSVKKTAESQ